MYNEIYNERYVASPPLLTMTKNKGESMLFIIITTILKLNRNHFENACYA